MLYSSAVSACVAGSPFSSRSIFVRHGALAQAAQRIARRRFPLPGAGVPRVAHTSRFLRYGCARPTSHPRPSEPAPFAALRASSERGEGSSLVLLPLVSAARPAGSAGPALRPCGYSSGAGGGRVANKGIRISFARVRNTVPQTSWPHRQNHGAVEKPQGWRASLALHFLLRASQCYEAPVLLSPASASFCLRGGFFA